MNVRIPSRALKAALRCVASKDELRYYLKGVLVDLLGRWANLVSSDGHVLFACKVEVGAKDTTIANLILPEGAIKASLKGGGRRTTVRLERLPDGPYALEGRAFEPIDARYPDYARVIPQSVSGEPGEYNPELLLRVHKAVRDFYGHRYADAATKLLMNGPTGGAVMVGRDETCVGVIMPWRTAGHDYKGFTPAAAEVTAKAA